MKRFVNNGLGSKAADTQCVQKLSDITLCHIDEIFQRAITVDFASVFPYILEKYAEISKHQSA